MKKDKFLAILLSSLVVLVGGVIWGALYSTNFYSTWVLLLIEFFAVLVFYKFHKKSKYGMLFYILILSAIVNYFAMCISAAISVKSIYEGVTFAKIFTLVLEVSFGECFNDTLFCMLFTLGGVMLGYSQTIFVNHRKEKKEETDSYPVKYKIIITELASDLKELNDTGDKAKFAEKYKYFRSEIIGKMTDDECKFFKNMTLTPIGEEYQDIARKLILKEILKREK